MTIAEKIFHKLRSAPAGVAQEVLDFLEFLEARALKVQAGPQRSWDQYMGVLKDSKAFEGNPVDIQRKLRDEWR